LRKNSHSVVQKSVTFLYQSPDFNSFLLGIIQFQDTESPVANLCCSSPVLSLPVCERNGALNQPLIKAFPGSYGFQPELFQNFMGLKEFFRIKKPNKFYPAAIFFCFQFSETPYWPVSRETNDPTR
jgi:hypothetical protein